jgi:hypothetical protein
MTIAAGHVQTVTTPSSNSGLTSNALNGYASPVPIQVADGARREDACVLPTGR